MDLWTCSGPVEVVWERVDRLTTTAATTAVAATAAAAAWRDLLSRMPLALRWVVGRSGNHTAMNQPTWFCSTSLGCGPLPHLPSSIRVTTQHHRSSTMAGNPAQIGQDPCSRWRVCEGLWSSSGGTHHDTVDTLSDVPSPSDSSLDESAPLQLTPLHLKRQNGCGTLDGVQDFSR